VSEFNKFDSHKLLHEKVFRDLNNKKIRYIVYKGFSHLKGDLEGDNGDLDVYVKPSDYKVTINILENLGFKYGRDTGYSKVFIGIDKTSLKYLQIELVSVIPVGKKPFYKDGLCFTFDERLIFKHQEFEEINVYRHSEELETYIKNSCKAIKRPKLELMPGLSSVDFDKKDKLFFVFKHILMYLKVRLNASQQNKMKGKFVAFVGIDGAGKSTISDQITEMPYFKAVGVKKIYFGNNNYWIPGLNTLARKFDKRFGKLFVSGLCAIDRQLRIFKAIYFKSLGCLVIADRFFYDDLLARQSNTIKRNGLIKFLAINWLSPRVIIDPNKIVLLDVDPLKSLARKGEHTEEKLAVVRTFYVDYLGTKKNCVIVDANQKEKKVLEDVVCELQKCYEK
jgi:thymidylate kinase